MAELAEEEVVAGVDFGAGVGEEGDAEGDEDGAEEVGALGELAEA